MRVIRRILHGVFLLAGVSLLSFALLYLAPGNFFDELRLNPQVSPATVSALRAEFGMDRPWPIRYLRWVSSAFHGDFGYSLSYHCPVGTLLWPRARNTLLLTSSAALLAWMIALPWGMLEALYRGAWIDRLGSLLTATLLAIPELLLALLFLLFAAKTGWFPSGGMTSTNNASFSMFEKLHDILTHLFLPVVVLVLGSMPPLVRYVRSAMAAVLDSPYIQSARGHGISVWRILYRHALPAASNSLISLLGFSIGALLSTSLLVEVVLSWPGLGSLMLEALLSRDIYVVVAVVLLSAVFLVLGNLIADLLLYWSDPRIRVART